jgi:carnitine O-acetyltransferase
MPPKRTVVTTAPRRSAQTAAPPPVYVEDPKQPPMLRYEASLPRLPVPALESTCAKYLETVRPHVDDAQFAASARAVEQFLASPLAAELQRRLKERADHPETKSWLADWWNDVAYMGYRDPVVVYVR